MLLSTPAYFTFLIAIFFAYGLVRRFRLTGLAVILFANYFFYARWDLAYLALIPIASTCDFAIGLGLGRSTNRALRRLLVTTSIVMNVGLIVSLKYMPFLHDTWAWVLPLGVSFYAFQSM